MKKTSLLALVLILIAAFAPIALATGPTQPDPGTGLIDTTTLYVGTIGWGPRRADTVRAYDTGSGELLFNTYDTLIAFGKPISNYWKNNWDVEEQYWDFEPSLAVAVPTRVEVNETFVPIPDFNWTIVIWNEELIDLPQPIKPIWPYLQNVMWEDAIISPPPSPTTADAYNITNWIDTNPGGIFDASDQVVMQAYWWAPTYALKDKLKEIDRWHVLEVDYMVVGPPFPPHTIRIALEWIKDPLAEPPVCNWYTSPQHPGQVFHVCEFIDNNPDGHLGTCDVVYLMKKDVIDVVWEKIGPRFHLLPVTCRTYHVRDVVAGTLLLHHWYYDFTMRTTPVINFVNELGVVVDTFDIYDAEYSFKRGLVQDQIGSPMWMYYKPFFDQMNADYTGGDPEKVLCLSYLIKDAVEIVSTNPPILRFNVGIAFPDAAFKQIMSQTWASIVSKSFSMGIGCWNDDLFTDSFAKRDCKPDWWTTYRRKSRTPYDTVGAYRYAGTGPYYVKVFDSVNLIVVLERNAGYWKGWPATDRKAFLQRIDIEYIADWAPRRDAFIACQLDVCAVPRAFMSELLDQYGEPKYAEIKTIKDIAPTLAMDAMHFTFTVDPTSSYLFTGSFPNGAPWDFFNNTFVRRAFAHGFDRVGYIRDAWLTEAICRETPLVYGLTPDYYTKGPDPPYTYDYSMAAAEANLKLAMFAGTSVWTSGFKLGLSYNTGNDQRRIACLMVRDFFGNLSTYDGRTGPPFLIDVTEIDWPTYLTYFEEYKLPIWSIGWLADFADADNWDRPYMHSWGDFSYFQNYTTDNGWPGIGPVTGLPKDILIDLAVKTPDGPTRASYYADLDSVYVTDCPGFPISQGVGRRWCKYWVKGWYYNAIYPAQYYYKYYKEQACWADITSDVVGVPEAICNMRDIGYIAQHFGALAPNPAVGIPYDPTWAPGVYGMAGCDVYGDRVVDMRDIGFACKHFGDTTGP